MSIRITNLSIPKKHFKKALKEIEQNNLHLTIDPALTDGVYLFTFTGEVESYRAFIDTMAERIIIVKTTPWWRFWS